MRFIWLPIARHYSTHPKAGQEKSAQDSGQRFVSYGLVLDRCHVTYYPPTPDGVKESISKVSSLHWYKDTPLTKGDCCTAAGKFQDSLEKNKSHQIWKLLEGVG
jgi:hypothetical protein